MRAAYEACPVPGDVVTSLQPNATTNVGELGTAVLLQTELAESHVAIRTCCNPAAVSSFCFTFTTPGQSKFRLEDSNLGQVGLLRLTENLALGSHRIQILREVDFLSTENLALGFHSCFFSTAESTL